MTPGTAVVGLLPPILQRELLPPPLLALTGGLPPWMWPLLILLSKGLGMLKGLNKNKERRWWLYISGVLSPHHLHLNKVKVQECLKGSRLRSGARWSVRRYRQVGS